MELSYYYNNQLYKTNKTDENIIVEEKGNVVTVKAVKDVILHSAYNYINHKFDSKDIFFLNGYQSWTDTREYPFGAKLRDVRKIPKFLNNMFAFSAYGDSHIVDYSKKNIHAFDYAYVRGDDPLFIGSNNYKNAYLIITFEKKKNRIMLSSDIDNKELKAGDTFTLFDYSWNNDYKRGMENYALRLKPRTDKKLFGYTSWYNHYQNINEEIILNALDKADKRFELFQIDDGYETFIGDWLNVDKKKFPNGLKPIVDKIHEKGMLAGIWLAPFVAETNSDLFKNHQELLAHMNGEPVVAGGNWSKHYALDLGNPDTVKYIRECLEYYKNLGFDFYKLDFIYGASIKPMAGKTHAETAEYAYRLLREILGDKLILGCGAILTNSFEKFDYLRIGPDVSLKFDDAAYMRLMHRERISTKTTLMNTVFRYSLNGHAFLNDPDVFLLRDDNMDMSKEQRYSLLMINSLFGSLLMTSDNPMDYDEEKKKLLDQGLNQFMNAHVLDYKRVGNDCVIDYELENKKYQLIYNMKNGVMKNGR